MRPTYADEAKWYLERSDLYKERDTLAQRCRALEDYIDNHSAITADYIARLQRTLDERDTLRAEVERLTGCLARANSQAEHFEREWYLRGDEVERLERIVHYLIRIHVVSDDEYDPDAAVERAMTRLKETLQ